MKTMETGSSCWWCMVIIIIIIIIITLVGGDGDVGNVLTTPLLVAVVFTAVDFDDN